jgi:hypothetical protein
MRETVDDFQIASETLNITTGAKICRSRALLHNQLNTRSLG